MSQNLKLKPIPLTHPSSDPTLNSTWWKFFANHPLTASSKDWATLGIWPSNASHFQCAAENNFYQVFNSTSCEMLTSLTNNYAVGLFFRMIIHDRSNQQCMAHFPLDSMGWLRYKQWTVQKTTAIGPLGSHSRYLESNERGTGAEPLRVLGRARGSSWKETSDYVCIRLQWEMVMNQDTPGCPLKKRESWSYGGIKCTVVTWDETW